MATDGEAQRDAPEDDMLPDERAVIAERATHLNDLHDDEYLTTAEIAENLGIDLE